MLFAWPILLQARVLLQFKEEVGAVVEEDPCASADNFFRAFIKLRLDKVGFVCEYGQSPIDLVKIESWLLQELSRLFIAGKL